MALFFTIQRTMRRRHMKQQIHEKLSQFLTFCKSHNRIFIVGISVITIGLIFGLNQITEFQADDFRLMVRYGTDTRTQSFGDVVYSSIEHYRHLVGRFWGHFIGYVLLWWQKPWCSFCNAIVVAILNLVLYHYGKAKSIFNLLLATVLIYFLNADFEGTINWISGSANYTWTILICLIFLIPYFHFLEQEVSEPRESVFMIPWMLLTGGIAGCTNENIGPTVLILEIIIMILGKKEKKHLPIWLFTGAFGTLLGVGVMLLSPGGFARNENIKNNINSGYGLFKTLLVRAYYMERAIFNYLFPTLLLVGVLLLILVYVYRELPDRVTILFILAGILSVGAMILAPTYPPRATMGSMVFFLVPIMRMLDQIVEKNEKIYQIACCSVWFCYVAFVLQLLTEIGYMILKNVSLKPDFL